MTFKNTIPTSRFMSQTSGKILDDKLMFYNAFNTNDGPIRYYSSYDCELYIGDTLIDEVVQISVQVNQNVMPLFGYNSYVYDQIAVGSRSVQGQLVINFIKSNYLIDLLKVENAANMPITNRLANDKEIANKQAFGPLFEGTFTIKIKYGEEPGHYEIIDGVQIISWGKSIGIGGDSLMESYQFIAKDIIPGYEPLHGSENSIVENNLKINADTLKPVTLNSFDVRREDGKIYADISVSSQNHIKKITIYGQDNVMQTFDAPTETASNTVITSFDITSTIKERRNIIYIYVFYVKENGKEAKYYTTQIVENKT